MTSYNALIEAPISPTVRRSTQWVDALEGYHPVVSKSARGLSMFTITFDAPDLPTATTQAMVIFQRAIGYSLDLDMLQVMTTKLYDQIADAIDTDRMPELIGVAEAVEILGYTRQYVNRMIADGKLTGSLIGNSMVLVKDQVERYARIHQRVADRHDAGEQQ